MITDYMGEDAEFERAALEEAGVSVDVATSARPEAWLSSARDADAIITRHARLDGDVIAALDRCRVIARYGAGVDNVDASAALERGIVVTYVPGGSTDEVADHTMGLILMAARGMLSMALSVREGGWVPRAAEPPRRLRGLRLGLVGGGRIGRAVAARAGACGMRPAVFDPALPDLDWATLVEDLDRLLEQSDVLSLHAPLTPSSRGLIGARELRLLPPGAIVVNTARGALLDLPAAMDALGSGHLGGLALDTFPDEPLPADHPIRRCERAVLTPHLAYCSTESLAHAKGSVVDEVLAVLSGRQPAQPWRNGVTA